MAVTITGGSQILPAGSSQAVDALSQSTATAEQVISVRKQITTLAGGTATGFTINRYTLPAANEGDTKIIVHLATGESYVRFGGATATANLMATGIHYLSADTAGVASATGVAGVFFGAATGALVMNGAQDYLRVMYLNGAWNVLGGQATIATST